MSEVLRGVSSFLQLLLNMSKLQAHALLDTLDKNQVRAVREIISNILEDNVELDEEQRSIVNRRRTVLQKIVKRKGQKSAHLIARHYRLVHHTLLMIKDTLLSLI